MECGHCGQVGLSAVCRAALVTSSEPEPVTTQNQRMVVGHAMEKGEKPGPVHQLNAQVTSCVPLYSVGIVIKQNCCCIINSRNLQKQICLFMYVLYISADIKVLLFVF